MVKQNNHKHDHEDHEKHGHEKHDHRDHHRQMIKDFKQRFYIALIVSIPIIILSPMIQDWFNFEITFTGDTALLLILSTFIYFYGGWPFLSGLINEVKQKTPGMMTLIALAISVAYIYSVATVFFLTGDDFFWELATLIAIMLLGHYIEMKSVLSASRALDELAKLMPDEAHLLKNGEVVDVSVDTLKLGDKILIKVGEKVPADGDVTDGESNVNESMLTGESKPVTKKAGDKLIGGSINGDGSLEMKIVGTGDDTYLSKVINMVQEAQASKSKTQNLADRAAKYLTYIAISVGLITVITWLSITGDIPFAIARMATVMVIACPHALGLATPLVVSHSTALSAQNGLLIRNRTAFENAGKTTTVVFDKTGTLTEGVFTVNFIKSFTDDYNDDDVLKLAATLEKNSEHPIASGIVDAAKDKNIKTTTIKNFKAIKGKGVEGTIDGKKMMIASPKHVKSLDIDIPDLKSAEYATNVFLLIEDALIGALGLGDKIRATSKSTIQALQNRGIECIMMTGDNETTAKKVSEALGLDGYFAEVLPEHKRDHVKKLQQKGRYIAMTGDGINDAPALAQADIGIAIGSGTDVAAETADIILVNSDPQDVLSLLKFGKATFRKMVQNLIWATGYNVVAIPLAAGVLYSIGILIQPAFGAVLMSLSTVIVAINAKLLKVE